jgi:hypothetical protein
MVDREGPQSWEETEARWDDRSIPEPDADVSAYQRPKRIAVDPRDLTPVSHGETDSYVPPGVPATFPPRGLREIPSRPFEMPHL